MYIVKITLATVASAIITLGIQATAMIALAPEQFGYFSLLYLVAALGGSLMLSVVSEAWARSERAQTAETPLSYASAAFYVALFIAVIAGGLALAIEPLRPFAAIGAIATFATVWRTGARFRSLHEAEWARVLIPDIAGALVAAAAGIALVTNYQASLGHAIAGWAFASVAAILGTHLYMPLHPRSIRFWCRRHRASIRPLLRDSIIMDASSIGTPYILVPILGVAGFGLYRAVSNVAAPVRLLLNPLRPALSKWPTSQFRRQSVLACVLVLSLMTGACAAATLDWLGDARFSLGTLTALAPYAVPVGIFVAANLCGHLYYLLGRTHNTARRLLTGRLVQTALSVLAPFVGALLHGVPGAIWSYVAATVVSATTWTVLALTQHR